MAQQPPAASTTPTSSTPPATATCQCGAVALALPAPSPLRVYHCHCTQCRRQSGSAFGTSAIYPWFDVPSALIPTKSSEETEKKEGGKLAQWSRTTGSGCRMVCYFCGRCGCRLVHARWKGEVALETVSVKGGCVEGLRWEGAAHIWTSEAVVPVPEGVEKWEFEPDD